MIVMLWKTAEVVLTLTYQHKRQWIQLHNDELNDLYSSPNIIPVIKSSRMKWRGHVARMGEGTGAYGVFVGKPEGKSPLGRPRRRWEDNTKMDIREIGWGHGLD